MKAEFIKKKKEIDIEIDESEVSEKSADIFKNYFICKICMNILLDPQECLECSN